MLAAGAHRPHPRLGLGHGIFDWFRWHPAQNCIGHRPGGGHSVDFVKHSQSSAQSASFVGQIVVHVSTSRIKIKMAIINLSPAGRVAGWKGSYITLGEVLAPFYKSWNEKKSFTDQVVQAN